MIEVIPPQNLREFEAGPDPFGRLWRVEFRWHQNAISIRHSDSIDLKYELKCEDETVEKVLALLHPDLLFISAKWSRQVTDPWCMTLGALHILHMVKTWEDMDKTIVTVHRLQLERYQEALTAPHPLHR